MHLPSVCLWQAIIIASKEFDDLELLRSTTASQTFEAFDRYFAASSHELYEFCFLTVVELLEYLKEPLDDRSVGGVVLINGVLL